MPGFTEAVLCWLPAKTAIEAAGKVEDGYCLFESELALLRERVGRREQTPSHLAAVAASASGLAIIAEQDAAGQALLDHRQAAGRRRHRCQVARRLLSPADPLPQQRELRLKEAVALLEEAVALLDLA